MPVSTLNIIRTRTNRVKYFQIFSFFWLVLFVLYFPAAKSGMVGDMPYWLDSLNHDTLWNYINIKHALVLYHTEQLSIYVLYKLFGLHPWPWHLVYLTIHAVNGLLLYILFSTLLLDSQVKNGRLISFIAACLFITCPAASEPVVWEAANHFLLVPCLIFLILVIVQKFHKEQKPGYALLAGFLFLYASFSLEFFYMTPWFVLLLICYYRFALQYDKVIFRKAISWFFVPLVVLLAGHFTLLRIVGHTFISHYGNLNRMPLLYYLDKPLKYLYHLLFFGRFFSHDARTKVYALCESKKAIFAFYGLFFCLYGYLLLRFDEASLKLKALALIATFSLSIYGFMSFLIFADSFLVVFDRYTYLANGFAYLLFVLLLSFINFRFLKFVAAGGYVLLNLWFTFLTINYWRQSTMVVDHLLNNFPDPKNKTVLLLNVPDNLKGIPMIGAEPEGRFRVMKNGLTTHPVPNKTYDVVAYTMSSHKDGAHVNVINDSVLHITLNQWGTWWLYGMLGASSYSNSDYTVNMTDPGHWYELVLKHPASEYIMLYQAGDQWKTVDWDKKNVDQN